MRGQREGPWGRTGLDVFPVQQVQLLLTPGNGSVTHRNTALEDWHLVPTPGPHLCRASRPSLGPPPQQSQTGFPAPGTLGLCTMGRPHQSGQCGCAGGQLGCWVSFGKPPGQTSVCKLGDIVAPQGWLLFPREHSPRAPMCGAGAA